MVLPPIPPIPHKPNCHHSCQRWDCDLSGLRHRSPYCKSLITKALLGIGGTGGILKKLGKKVRSDVMRWEMGWDAFDRRSGFGGFQRWSEK